MLAQRHVDRLRAARRLDPLPDNAEIPERPAASGPQRADRERLSNLAQDALAASVARLEPRDRLRLGLYYAQDMTLAAIGRALRESEATASRHLARTRRALRDDVAAILKTSHHMDERTIDECFQSLVDDPGALDLGALVKDSVAGTF